MARQSTDRKFARWCSSASAPRPLRGIPLQITVEGVAVTGIIDYLFVNDITVVITSHGAGRRKGLHVPHFAMYKVNWLAECAGNRTTAITPRGQQRAEALLRELVPKTRCSATPRHQNDEHISGLRC